MCFSSSAPAQPAYTYESFKPNTSTKPNGPANDAEARAPVMNDAQATAGGGLGASGPQGSALPVGAMGARTRRRGTTLG